MKLTAKLDVPRMPEVHFINTGRRLSVRLQYFDTNRLRVWKDGKILFQGSRRGLIEWLTAMKERVS